MSSIKWDLEVAQRLIEGVVQQLEAAPEKAAIIELIATCESQDRHYKKTCEEVDLDNGDPIGTAYEDGFNMEYYMDSDSWQEISEALRVLRKDK